MKKQYTLEELPKDIQDMVKEQNDWRVKSVQLYDEHKKTLGVIDFLNDAINKKIQEYEKNTESKITVADIKNNGETIDADKTV